MRSWRLGPIPVLVISLTACGQEDASGPVTMGICGPVDPVRGFAARDSSGVQIVENLTPTREEPLFEVGSEALGVIGGRESDPEDVIGRLASAVLLDDGRVVVADAATREIRVHAPGGGLLHRFGGEGSGPGELSRSVSLFRGPGDTLIVAHEFGLAYARMLPDGRYLDGGSVTEAAADAPARLGLRGVFGDGAFLVNDILQATPAPEDPVYVSRTFWHVVRRLDPASGALDSVGALPREEHFAVRHQGGEFAGYITFGSVPFGRVESWALGREELFVGEGTHFEVERRAADGRLTGLWRICEEQEAVNPEEFARAIDEYVARFDDADQRREREALSELELPTTKPAHLDMLVGRDGRLWVRDFGPPWEEGSWRVFDTQGRWIGSVTMPPRTRLLDLAGDRVLVELTDELGGTTVRVLPLR